jgi:hypothetical protein
MATREEQLFQAADTGDLEMVQNIIRNGGVNIEWKNPANRYTALHIASLIGHIPVVNFLIQSGSNVNVQERYGFTPLHFATYNGGNLPLVELLLENGANPNIQNMNVDTPLQLAVQSGNKEIVRALLAGGADRTIKNGSYMGNARQIAQILLLDAETEEKQNKYKDIINIIDQYSTLNTMYAVKEGLNPEKNEFNQIDPSDWKELHELSYGEKGGKKRRKQRTKKRRKSNKRRNTMKKRKSNKKRKQRGGRNLLTTTDSNLLCERIRGIFNSYDTNGNIRYMGLQELKTILCNEDISDTILPIWDDGNDPSQLDTDIQNCIDTLLNNRIILRDNNTNLLFRNQNLQM